MTSRVALLVGLIGSSSAWQPTLLRTAAPNTNPWGGSPDMEAVINLRKEYGSAGVADRFTAREQGLYQQILAMDGEEPVGTAHLGRLFVGGYAILKLDFFLSTVVVKDAYRRKGIGSGLVTELLHRVPAADFKGQLGKMWAFADADDEAMQQFLKACGGSAIGSLSDVAGSENALVAAALAISAGGLTSNRNGIAYRFAGLGAEQEYNNAGRLERPES